MRRALQFLKTPRDMVAYYFHNLLGLPRSFTFFEDLVDWPCNIVIPFFKKMQITMHDMANSLPPGFKNFIDLPNLAGYPPMAYRAMTDDPVQWLTQPQGENSYTAEWWEHAIFRVLVSQMKGEARRVLSLEQFALSRWMWVSAGATKFSHLELDSQVVKTKFAAAVSLSDREILDLVRHSRADSYAPESDIGIFIKPDEPGYKRRLIANVPLGPYIVAAYVRYLIEDACGSPPPFATLSPSLPEMYRVIHQLQFGVTLVPLDESAYDYHVPREAWLGFFSALKRLWPHNEGVEVLESYFSRAVWQFEGQRGRWVKGMPSGLALTTLVNTLFNYIKQTAILPDSTLHYACGDDALLAYQRPVNLEEVAAAYAKFGAEVNAKKNWQSHTYSEYLKGFYTREGRCGYPARLFGTLLWAQSIHTWAPADRLSELAELWKQLYDRLLISMDVDVVCRDLARAVSKRVAGFTLEKAKLWLHAPRVHGGFGRLPNNNLIFEWHLDVEKISFFKGAKVRLPPMKRLQVRQDCPLTIRRFTLKRGVQLRVGPPFRLPKITNLEQWQRRLLREDYPKFGPFSDLALGCIPLPVVDGISTACMSLAASYFGFNSYPLLGGSWDTVSSRMVLSSRLLVESLSKWMSARSLHYLV